LELIGVGMGAVFEKLAEEGLVGARSLSSLSLTSLSRVTTADIDILIFELLITIKIKG
jgi:hypothetical protein